MRAKLITAALAAFIAFSAFAGVKEDLSKEMLKLMDMQKMMEQVISQVQQMQMTQMKQLNIPEQDQEKVAEFQRKLNAKLAEAISWDKLEPEYVKLFSEVYTEEELKAIVGFYKTPAGQSMLKKQPLLMQKSMVISQKNIQAAMPEIQRMTQEFKDSMKK